MGAAVGLRHAQTRRGHDPRGSAGAVTFRNAPIQPLVEDILPAPETWVNTAWLGLDYTAVPRLEINNKLKYRIYNQAADDPRDIDGRPLEDASVLFGLINKAEYGLPLGRLSVTPRLKSELCSRTRLPEQTSPASTGWGWRRSCSSFPWLRRSQFTAGLELAQFHDLVLDEEDVIRRAELGKRSRSARPGTSAPPPLPSSCRTDPVPGISPHHAARLPGRPHLERVDRAD